MHKPDLPARLRAHRGGLSGASDIAEAATAIEALEERVRVLSEALRPFANCADELDGTEFTPRAPEGDWAKFRLLTDDYRRARATLNQESPDAGR